VPELPSQAEREAIRRELGAESGDLVALWAGQLEPHKDPLTFAAGIGLARRRGTLVAGFLLGEGTLRHRLEGEPGLSLLGYRDDLVALLGGCDVFVSTSVREGLSLVLLEAMALARPVVATDGPGNPEAVGEAGLVIPTGDPDALASALERLATDSALRARLGRAARARVASEFGAERMVEQTRRVYERALGGA
jgi:glycosyltransferase involved in cell wall biosynthesis